MPALPPEARCRHEFGRGRGNPPARGGGGRTVDQILLGHRPPAPNDQGGHACGLSRQLQTAGGGQAETRDLADDGRQALLAQALLNEWQDLPLALGLGIDHPVRMKAGAQETGGEQVPSRQAPEHGSLEAGRDSCGEQGRAAGKLGGKPRLDHLVQSTPGKSASRQMAIDGAEVER